MALVRLRFLLTSWRITFASLSRSTFFIVSAVVQPVIFATIAFYMAAPAEGEQLVRVGLGAALIGAWSATVIGSGSLLHWERWQRTLELLVTAPVHIVYVIVPMTLATASLGLYSLTATLAWGAIAFDMPLEADHPLLFVVAVLATIVSLGLLGVLLASTFILSRHATILASFLSYPVWLLTGLLVPLALLPTWVEPIGWALAPTWGLRAMQDAVVGGNPWPEIVACGVLGVAYLLLGSVFADLFLRLARRRATLSLA
ncbi:MAG: ABC transporter permease [Gaiellaceae bacterium]